MGARTGSGAIADACAAGGGLTAALPTANPPGDASATWRFDAPAGRGPAA